MNEWVQQTIWHEGNAPLSGVSVSLSSLLPITLPLNATRGHNIFPSQSFSNETQFLPLSSLSGTPMWGTFLSELCKQRDGWDSCPRLKQSFFWVTLGPRAELSTAAGSWEIFTSAFLNFFFKLWQFERNENFSSPKDGLTSKLILLRTCAAFPIVKC